MSQDDRKFYLSLDGAERGAWKRTAAIFAAGIFVSGMLIGFGLGGAAAGRTSAPREQPAPEAADDERREPDV